MDTFVSPFFAYWGERFFPDILFDTVSQNGNLGAMIIIRGIWGYFIVSLFWCLEVVVLSWYHVIQQAVDRFSMISCMFIRCSWGSTWRAPQWICRGETWNGGDLIRLKLIRGSYWCLSRLPYIFSFLIWDDMYIWLYIYIYYMIIYVYCFWLRWFLHPRIHT